MRVAGPKLGPVTRPDLAVKCIVPHHAGAGDKSAAELERERAEARAAVEGTRGRAAQTKVSHKKLNQVKVRRLCCTAPPALACVGDWLCALRFTPQASSR